MPAWSSYLPWKYAFIDQGLVRQQIKVWLVWEQGCISIFFGSSLKNYCGVRVDKTLATHKIGAQCGLYAVWNFMAKWFNDVSNFKIFQIDASDWKWSLQNFTKQNWNKKDSKYNYFYFMLVQRYFDLLAQFRIDFSTRNNLKFAFTQDEPQKKAWTEHLLFSPFSYHAGYVPATVQL